jgi:hypothetical protein
MARTRGKAKAGVISVDFTGVESSGKVEEGRQLLTVDGTPEIKVSENSGADYINWKFKAQGGAIYHTTSLQPQALWNLRNVLEALGLEVPEAAMDLDLSEMDGLTCGGEVEHEVYQGKKRPRLIDLFPEEELDEEQEEEKPKGKSTAKGKAEPEPEPESEDPSYEEVMEMDKEELVELAGEYDITLTVKQKRNVDTLRQVLVDALELEAEEEEEPEEKPKASSRRKAGSSKELAKGSKVTFVDDGEDIEGTVKSINVKEKFAVVDVDGEEWEVELSDLTVA